MINPYLDSFTQIVAATVITDKDGRVQKRDDAFQTIADNFIRSHENGGTIYLIGNGGSSGIISHSSIDLINACKLRAMPLTDNSILTCLANDYGYENVFAEGLKTLFTERDILIAVSSSGSSRNILNAVSMAKGKGGMVVTYSGFRESNALRSMGNYNFWLNSMNYGKVEIGHALLLHILTDEIGRRRMPS